MGTANIYASKEDKIIVRIQTICMHLKKIKNVGQKVRQTQNARWNARLLSLLKLTKFRIFEIIKRVCNNHKFNKIFLHGHIRFNRYGLF